MRQRITTHVVEVLHSPGMRDDGNAHVISAYGAEPDEGQVGSVKFWTTIHPLYFDDEENVAS